MSRIAYLANLFPVASEPYVAAEIRALRARGAQVIACSVRHPSSDEERDALKQQTLYFTHVRARLIFRSLALAAKHRRILANIIKEAFSEKSARLSRRLRALVHTALGIYFAALIEDRAICHVHVHHGYFASWIAMVAARVLNISYSITFHGSDLLLHGAFLKTKLEHCRFCTTISEFNRTVLVSAQPTTAEKIFICRMGVMMPHAEHSSNIYNPPFSIFAAGRLHPVKDFDFLLRGCRTLIDSGFDFRCRIAGEGNERKHLEELLDRLSLRDHVTLLGQQSSIQMEAHYRIADLLVLTSRSEGIPLVLMEAMARQQIVLAPRITGIPELVIDGKTGFLYAPGDLADFVRKVRMIERSTCFLQVIRRAASNHVVAHFERKKNVAGFCDLLISQISAQSLPEPYAHPVLQ